MRNSFEQQFSMQCVYFLYGGFNSLFTYTHTHIYTQQGSKYTAERLKFSMLISCQYVMNILSCSNYTSPLRIKWNLMENFQSITIDSFQLVICLLVVHFKSIIENGFVWFPLNCQYWYSLFAFFNHAHLIFFFFYFNFCFRWHWLKAALMTTNSTQWKTKRTI